MTKNNFPVANELDIPAALNRAYAHWNAGQAPQAEQLCQYVLAVWPHQADALHLLGIMAHAYGNLDEAIKLLRMACQMPCVPAIYFSNLAEMCRQKGLLAEAEQAAQQAVSMDGNLLAAWSNLGIILQESGKFEASMTCLERVVALQPESAQAHNNLANTYRRLDHFIQAKTHYEHAIGLQPDYAEAHSNMAFLLSRMGQFDAAVLAGRQAVELNPQLVDAYLNLADTEMSRMRHGEALRWLDALQVFAPRHPAGLTARALVLKTFERLDDALVCAREAVQIAPENAKVHHILGQILQALGQHEQALAAFDLSLSLPGAVSEEVLISRALLLQERGDVEAAAGAFDKALEAFPRSGRIMAARAHSKTYQADDGDIAVMEAQLRQAQQLPLAEQLTLHFALVKAYLDTADSAQAFFHMDRGNRIKRSTYSHDPQAIVERMKAIAAAFPETLQTRYAGSGTVSTLPVFIVGMPRSGTRLIAQILAAHPQVHGAGELRVLHHALESAGIYPDTVGQWSMAELARIGRGYLDHVEPLAKGKARLIDNMPTNFLYAGMLPLILPGARIIHCRRDPVDTCLSCYSKLFPGDLVFAHDQAELGHFYRAYESLMAHWRSILPVASFIDVDYEDLVDDPVAQAKRLIDFIDLPWNEACLALHRTRRVARTASMSELGQPIYTTPKGRWRAHAAHLGPLLAALDIKSPCYES